MPLAAPELSEAECCRWLGIFARRRYTILLFLGPDRAQLCMEQVEASESGDEEEVEEIEHIGRRDNRQPRLFEHEMSLPLALASSSAPLWILHLCMSSRWRRVVVTLFAVYCSSEGGPLEEQNEQQCLHLDGYPGRCPIYIMKGACYSDQEGVAWACMTDGLDAVPPAGCSSMQLPPPHKGAYAGYCSFYLKPTTPTTTSTTTPCPVSRLRIVNRCMEKPIWIAHEAAGGKIGPSRQNVKIEPDDFHDFCTPDKLVGTRYWPKMLCDEDGVNCLLGSSGGPGEGCSGAGQYLSCAPPIDTKFEATFGRRGAPCNGQSSQDCDFVDVSLVDGWTLPFRLLIAGSCSGGGNMHPDEIDCSGLTFEQCPTAERLGTKTYDMQARHWGSGSIAGCYSPCLKLTDPKWNNTASTGRSRTDDVAAPYCCPTPPISPQACRAGPVEGTEYVKAVHKYCPGVYAYCYDDAMGLLQCSADSSYQVEFFCPWPMPSWNYVWVTSTRTSSSHTQTSATSTRTTTSFTTRTASSTTLRSTLTSTRTSVTATTATVTKTTRTSTSEQAAAMGAKRRHEKLTGSASATTSSSPRPSAARLDERSKRTKSEGSEAFYVIAGCSLGAVAVAALGLCVWHGACPVRLDESVSEAIHRADLAKVGVISQLVHRLCSMRWNCRKDDGDCDWIFASVVVIVVEEDIPPLSLSGVWRSVAVQLEVYKERPAPSCAFSLALLTWVAALYRILRTDFPPPGPAGLCMDPAAVRFAQGFEAKRWLLHALWPLEPGYLRGFLSSSLLLVLGYSLEYELGSVHFCGLLLGLQIGAAFLLLHFRFSMCVISLEPAMAGLAVIAHRVNPKVHSDGLGAALKLPFEVEPRWHIWVLLGLLLMQAGDFPNALVVHAAGLLLGAVVVLREPEVWGDAWHALVGRSFTCGAVAHIVLFVFTIVFMPLTVPEAPPDMLALFQAALADGRLFKLSWWRDSIPSSLPLLHMAISGQLGGEALYICRFLLSIALPLLLSSMRLWAVAQEGMCFASGSFELSRLQTRLYSVFFVILLMPLGTEELTDHVLIRRPRPITLLVTYVVRGIGLDRDVAHCSPEVSSFFGAHDGCWMKDAYHTAVVVDNAEYTFTPSGIMRNVLKGQLDPAGNDGVSYFRGVSTISGPTMVRILLPFFKEGTYDVLKKNCNTFSDCALFCLLGERLPIKYRTIEKVAGVLDDVTGVVQALTMCNYKPNPQAGALHRCSDGRSAERERERERARGSSPPQPCERKKARERETLQ
ncbi:TL1 [Symbiodinium sp. KB8]|nr:TL1 [Symbiodinium sp. KB8]